MDTFLIGCTIWLCGLLTCCSALHLWFTTTIGAELFLLFNYDTTADLKTMTRQDFDVWLIQQDLHGRLDRRLVHILTCPGCLSVHVSLLVSLPCVLFVILYGATALPTLNLWLACMGAWPWLIHVLHKSSHA